MTTNCLPTLETLPRLAFVSTGGTIAGTLVEGAETWRYESAQRSGESLVMGVPGLLRRAQWLFEQPYSIGSQNLELSHMLQLRALVLRLLASPDVDGVLITHGTDTLEDMLYFLYLTLPTDSLTKPLLFTAAMLPSDHEQADGPANLSCAVDLLLESLSTSPSSVPFGLVMQGLFTPAAAVEKKSTASLDAFDGAYSVKAAADWQLNIEMSDLHSHFGTPGEFATLFNADTTQLPLFEALEVPLVYCAPGNGPVRQLDDLLNRKLSRKPAAVVVAAPGHGNIPDVCVPALRRLLLNGVSVVRASRVTEGGVERGGEFDALDEFREEASNPASSRNGGAGVFSESGHLSLSKCVVRERLKVLARSLSS